MLHAMAQVVRFEARRTRTGGRLAIWLGLAVFPTLLMLLARSQAQQDPTSEQYTIVAYYLVVQVGCLLGLLLWATPAIGSELESQTWIYLAMRPHGKTAVLLGKYAVAAAWTASAGILSAIGVSIAGPIDEPLRLAAVLVALVLMASLCYSALFVFIGAAVASRATVVAVVYTLLFEGLMSNVPATVNKLTVCYRLRALLADWMGLSARFPDAEKFFGNEPVWEHLACLVLYTAVILALATWTMRSKEFPIGSDA
jgi:ABC-type transport system involved in multi-copper enzyme maturation permease subunit